MAQTQLHYHRPMPDLPSKGATLPSALRANARWLRLGQTGVPAMLVRPLRTEAPAPIVIWMHGRTVNKELDPGRYLRWMRTGIGTCALDLPGHGERFDARLQAPEATLEVVATMLGELDGVIEALGRLPGEAESPDFAGRFDLNRI